MAKFQFPDGLSDPTMSLDTFLGERKHHDTPGVIPEYLPEIAKNRIAEAKRTLAKRKVDLTKTECALDMDGDFQNARLGINYVPTLLYKMTEGYWLIGTSRRLSANEVLRLQGMEPKKLRLGRPSDEFLMQAAGNAMTVNVLIKLAARILNALGIAPTAVKVRGSYQPPLWSCLHSPSSNEKVTRDDLCSEDTIPVSPEDEGGIRHPGAVATEMAHEGDSDSTASASDSSSSETTSPPSHVVR